MKHYRTLLDGGQVWDAANDFRKLTLEVSEEVTRASDSGAPILKPSKAYKRMRALLQDPGAVNLFFNRALGLPRAGNEPDLVLLVSNLGSLEVLLECNEFKELLLKAGALAKLQPLASHTATWLGRERFLKGAKDERTIVGQVLKVMLPLINADMGMGLAFLNESRLLAQFQQHLPWKTHPKLDLKTAAEAVTILVSVAALVSLSAMASRERAAIVARFATDDVMGWVQRMLL